VVGVVVAVGVVVVVAMSTCATCGRVFRPRRTTRPQLRCSRGWGL
jgi:hypothetical protein